MKLLIPVLVGGLIGYFTNWLAIKMLFRPYEEKYLFGFKLPFTPGLIPKEQKRIAKSVGDTVADYLLSEEIIIKNIEKHELEEKLKTYLLTNLEELGSKGFTLGDLVTFLYPEEAGKRIEKRIGSIIAQNLRDDDFKSRLDKIFIEKIDGFNLDKELFSEKFKAQWEETRRSGKLDKYISLNIEKKLEDMSRDKRALREIVDEENLERLVDKKLPLLIDLIKDLVDDFDFSERVKTLIADLLEKNVSKTVRLFIGLDGLSERIYSIGEDYIYREDFQDKLRPLLLEVCHKALDYSPEEIISKGLVEKSFLDGLISKLGDFLMSHDNRDLMSEKLESLIGEKEIYYKDALKKELIKSSHDFIQGSSLDSFLEANLEKIFKQVERKTLGELMDSLGDDGLESIIDRLVKILKSIFESKLKDLLKLFSISQIVEEEINNFEVDFAEEIILDIASKELKAITWLGALLGAILGLISPLLQFLQ